MSITRSIRTPIMHRAVEANGFVFLGGTIADDTSVSMGEQTRNILGKIAGYLKEAGTDKSRVVSASIFVTDLSKRRRWTRPDRILRRRSADPRHRGRRRSRRQRADRGGGDRAQGLRVRADRDVSASCAVVLSVPA